MGKGTKDKRDIYYRKAKEEGWSSRSAFKLLQIDSKFHILESCGLVCSSSSWSQVLSRKLYLGENVETKSQFNQDTLQLLLSANGSQEIINEKNDYEYKRNDNVKIIAVDLQPMAPLPGVIQIQGDITKYSTAQEITKHFEGTTADLVICDGAPDVTGLHCMDIYIQSQLLLGALHIACNVLKVGGNFVAKIFHGKDNDLLINQLLLLFKDVVIVKPSSSRNSSIEAFVVCMSYCPPEGFDPTAITPFLDVRNKNFESLTGVNAIIIPFLVCGDVSIYNTAASYQEKKKCEKELSKSANLPPYSFVNYKHGRREELNRHIEECEARIKIFKTIKQHTETTTNCLNDIKIPAQDSVNPTIFENSKNEAQFDFKSKDTNFKNLNEKLASLRTQISNNKLKLSLSRKQGDNKFEKLWEPLNEFKLKG